MKGISNNREVVCSLFEDRVGHLAKLEDTELSTRFEHPVRFTQDSRQRGAIPNTERNRVEVYRV